MERRTIKCFNADVWVTVESDCIHCYSKDELKAEVFTDERTGLELFVEEVIECFPIEREPRETEDDPHAGKNGAHLAVNILTNNDIVKTVEELSKFYAYDGDPYVKVTCIMSIEKEYEEAEE